MQNIIKSNLLSQFSSIHHGTSTKLFGPLSFRRDPNVNEVIIDRAEFLQKLNLPINHSIFVCEQNHTDNIVVVDECDEGKGVFDQATRIPNTDAMITNRKGVNLVIYTADCAPVLIFDPINNVIAAVHSGWKGTVKQIANKTIQKMIENFDCQIENIIVYIGPTIGRCCYAVTNEEQIQAFGKYKFGITRKENKVFVDLKSSLEEDLLQIGVLTQNFEISDICTACSNSILASHYIERENRKTDNLTVIAMM